MLLTQFHFLHSYTSYTVTLLTQLHFLHSYTSYTATLLTQLHFLHSYTSYTATLLTQVMLLTQLHFLHSYTSYTSYASYTVTLLTQLHFLHSYTATSNKTPLSMVNIIMLCYTMLHHVMASMNAALNRSPECCAILTILSIQGEGSCDAAGYGGKEANSNIVFTCL